MLLCQQLFLNYHMKKNYSEKFLKDPTIIITTPKIQSIQKSKPSQSPIKRVFQRKPAGGHLPLTRKRADQSVSQVDSTMEQTNFSVVLQKSKNLRFISSRSQASLNTSTISKSSASLSFANSRNDDIEEEPECSRFLPDESIIPGSPYKESCSRELFRRKTAVNLRTPGINKKTHNENSGNISMATSKFNRNIDKAQEQTKLESSEFSDLSKSFCTPSAFIIKKNIVCNSKNSSKQSMRKSSSSNSLIKKQAVKQCQDCEYNIKELKEMKTKNQRLQRMLRSKDDQISDLNKRLQQNQKKNRDLEKKVKQLEKSDFQKKISVLEEQLNDSQEECLMLKDTYSKTLQELKYKNVQNSTLKKYQAQCQSLQRKLQMLVSQRNDLRQRLSNVKAQSKSSYMNYPSSFSRQSKNMSRNNLVVQHNQFSSQNEKKRQIYTSRSGQDNEQFDDQGEGERSFLTVRGGFRKKPVYNKCYQDSSESEIISLSEESNF